MKGQGSGVRSQESKVRLKGQIEGSECRTRCRVYSGDQESKARAISRARVQGEDQGQSARSGSGSKVRDQESTVRIRGHTQGQSTGSGAGFKIRIQGSGSEFKGQGRTPSQSEGKYRSRLSISIRGPQSKIMTIPRARVQGQE